MAALLCLLLVALGWLQVSRYAKRKVNDKIAYVSKKLGVPVEVGRWQLGLFAAHFEDVTIGEGAQIVVSRVSASVNLNPFDGKFGELDEITIHKVRVKSPVQRFDEELGKLDQLGKSDDDDDDDDGPRKRIEQLFQALPTQKLWLRSGNITLVDENGDTQLTVKGLKLLVEKKPQKVLFRVDGFKTASGIAETGMQGRLQLQRSGDYRFFVKKKLREDLKINAWSVSGYIDKTMSKAQLAIELRQLPGFLAEKAEPVLGQRQLVNLKANVDAVRGLGKTWNVTSRVRSNGTRIAMPLVSNEPIGPIVFDATVQGFVRTDERIFGIETATVNVPMRKGLREGRRPLRFILSGTGRLPVDGLARAGFQGQVRLMESSCQDVLDASPPGLLSALTEFKLDGEIGGVLEFKVDMAKHDNTTFALNDTLYGCVVKSTPYTYSDEHLKGPFTLQRELVGTQTPIEISVSPMSPGFTPLAHIARSVNAAFITSEDAAFFTHKGIDLSALENAARRNFAEGRVAVGGSTITMQTVKNLFLSQDRTISRKLQELFLAWHLENILDKKRILEIYVNIVEFGPGIFGITRASEHFFGKEPEELTPLESAYLASLLPSPKNRYRYFCEGRMSPAFRDMVYGLLKRMVNLNRIDYDHYSRAMQSGISFNAKTRATSPECGKQYASGDVGDTKS